MTANPTIDPADLRPGALDAGVFRGHAVTVLGFARSGIALARFLHDVGAAVTVYDGRPAAELAHAIEALEGRTVRLLLGPEVDPAIALEGAALIASSPSVNADYPTTEPRLRAALRSVIDRRRARDMTAPAVVSEVDLFLRLCPAPTVGITGTKGKTTTSALAQALLATDPAHPAVLGGNIGKPLVERLPELTPDHRVVVELSELQLPTLSRGTTLAAYTNVTADHLDRHGSLEAYRGVKRRLGELVEPEGAIVLNGDDAVVGAYTFDTSARVVRYRRGEPAPGGVGLAHGWIVADALEPIAVALEAGASPFAGGRIMPVEELGIPGAHNVSNALAAVSIALLFGIDPAAIRPAAAGFAGVEHRLEHVADVDGVRFINDSQGTQPDAVIAALRAFDGPIVLIAGGRDKGVDLTELATVVAERARAAVLIGESAPLLERLFRDAGLETTVRSSTLDAAVAAAEMLAREAAEAADGAEAAAASAGAASPEAAATVLLSPAATSFDMFEDYEARGRAFKAAVRRLVEERG
jgi:UDP-N-acetylmuramoylalanine--D-glutamate ligase